LLGFIFAYRKRGGRGEESYQKKRKIFGETDDSGKKRGTLLEKN